MGKGKVKMPGPGPLENEQAKFLRGQRENVIEPVQAALMPAALPGAIQAFSTKLEAPDREALEGQFSQAKNSIMDQAGGRGGFLRRAMTMNDIARAQTVGNAAVNARQQGITRALGLLGPAAFPGANTTLQAGQGLVNSEQGRAQMAAQASAQQGQGIGSAIGGLASIGGRAMLK